MPQKRRQMAKPWETTTRFLILIGLIVTAIGAATYEIHKEWNAPVLALLISGPVLAIACIAVNFRWVLGLFAQRKALLNLNMVVVVGLAGAVVVGVNWFSERHYRRHDSTQASRYSLRSQTKQILKNLEKEVRVYTFFTANAAVFQDFPFVPLAKDTLDEYRATSSKLEVQHLDVMRDIKKIRELLEELKLEDLEHNSVVFACGEAPNLRTKVVKTYDMVYTDYSGRGGEDEDRIRKFKGEEAFTSAILTVLDEKKAVACFLTGHGERGIDDYQKRGYSDLKNELKKANLEVEELDLNEKGKVPDNCAVLVIAGPTAEVPDRHLKSIEEYLRRHELQGDLKRSPSLLVLLEPVTRETGLAPILKNYNVEALEQTPVIGIAKVPVMTQNGFQLKESLSMNLSVTEYPEHELTGPLKGTASNFTSVVCVRPLVEGARAEFKARTILQGTEKTWGETNFRKIVTQRTASYEEDEDIPGPVPFGVAAESTTEGGPRVVVIGDADFPSRELLRSGRGNIGLALNSVLWLARKTTRLGLPPIDPEHASLELTRERKKAVKVAAVYALPAAWILFALGVWVLRTIALAESDRAALTMRFGAVLGILFLIFGAVALTNGLGAGIWGTLGALGLALLALGIAANVDWVKEMARERRTWYGANVVTMAALGVVVLGIVNYVSGRNYDRRDTTEKQLHALSAQTIAELKKVDRPINTTLILPSQRWNLVAEHMQDVIEEFGRYSAKIGLNRIEYSEDTQYEVEALSEQLKVQFDGEMLPLVIFNSTTNVKQVNPPDVVQQEQMDPRMMQMMQMRRMSPPPPKLIGERAFLDAVLTVAEDDKVTLYFSTGNGERHPEKFEEQDLGELAKLLKRANYAVKTIELEQVQTIPSDCDILVLAAPMQPYGDNARNVIREHLANEGSLLVLAEPEFITGITSGLEDLLMEYNIKLDERSVVVDMVARLAGFDNRMRPVVRREPDVTVEVSEFGYHQTTRDLKGNAAFFMHACAVDVVEEPGGGPSGYQPPGGPPQSKWNTASLVKSRSDKGWIDRDAVHGEKSIKFDEGLDTKGKASIGVAIEPNQTPQQPPNRYMPAPPPDAQRKGPHIVVFGDADFASNALIREVPGNEKLAMNVVQWLGKQEPRKFDDIPPKEIDVRTITPDPKRLRENYYLSLFGLPGLCLVFALGIWLVRRR